MNAPLPCSDVEAEPLPGTAKTGSAYVLFEWPEAWPRDVLKDATFGEALTADIAAHLDGFDASLLLIRHPTREGRNIDDHHVYLVFAEEGVIEVLHVDGPEALLNLDLSGPGRNGAQVRNRPLLLICTHAKRDVCCAVKGRPMVAQMHSRHPGDLVWETSHIKGHRFAPTMLLMPWAYSFGRMNVEATDAMLTAAIEGQFFVPGNRGRGTLGPAEQVAEIAVAEQLARTGTQVSYGGLQVGSALIDGSVAHVAVKHAATDRTYRVELTKQPVTGVVDSCGKPPKESFAWKVESLT